MDQIFRLPKPRFNNNSRNEDRRKMPHFSTPQGMLLPRKFQPPPMYGPRGSTVPPKFLNNQPKPGPSKQEKFWCETCDRDFNSNQDLQLHLNEHQKCGRDGCSFIGHPKVVERHIAEQHNSGLYDQIKKLSTPEEISQWREERRKRYPTRQNVELRQQVQEAKIKRGEKIDQPKNRFGRKDDRRQIQKNVFGKPIFNNNFKQQKQQKNHTVTRPQNLVRKPEANTKETLNKSGCVNGNLPMFSGTTNLLNYERPKLRISENNPLSSLLGIYGSDNDDESAPEDSETESEEESKRRGLGNFEDIKPVSATGEGGSQNLPTGAQMNENNIKVDNKLKVVSESNQNDQKNKQLLSPGSTHNNDKNAESPAHTSAPRPQLNNDFSSSDEMPEDVPIRKTTREESPKPSTSRQSYNDLRRQHLLNSSSTHNSDKPKPPAQTSAALRPQLDNDFSSSDELPEEVPIQKSAENKLESPKPSTSRQSYNDIKPKKLLNSGSIPNSDEKSDLPGQTTAPRLDNDCSSIEEMPEEVPIQKTTEHELQAPPKPSTSHQNHLKRKQKDDHTRPRRKFILDYSKAKTKPQNTMLEKLLEPDIRHERNVMLQCVRFVVENNFFGIGSKK